MESLILAFASDDGVNYSNNHFGDAASYLLYEFTPESAEFLKKIGNTTKGDSEEIHADPRKAGNVVNMLKKEKVQAVVSAVYGPNIKRIKTQFACVIIKQGKISDSIPFLMDNFEEIQNLWNKGEYRDFLNLKKS
ncbi:MAG: dinitrogenase iron-molybdenum cofactor biosynthesis protein [Candidatus Cloacimonetes bacterium]|nr:dinitrogenase iron-molybdenum cofactor biosynthesis protein [Candidatus Cloacimonadota bacterium]